MVFCGNQYKGADFPGTSTYHKLRTGQRPWPTKEIPCVIRPSGQCAKPGRSSGSPMGTGNSYGRLQKTNQAQRFIIRVVSCRKDGNRNYVMVNSGDYNLPPVPQLKDFDTELAAYKEHVKEEIAQEAAAAGMTVEEYAANGYEPSHAEYIYKVEANPRSTGSKDLYFLQAYETTEEKSRVIPRDVLYIGTPEKCRELMGRLVSGELTQEAVKELYAAEQAENTFSIYQLKDDVPVDFHFRPLEEVQGKGLAVDPANYETQTRLHLRQLPQPPKKSDTMLYTLYPQICYHGACACRYAEGTFLCETA